MTDPNAPATAEQRAQAIALNEESIVHVEEMFLGFPQLRAALRERAVVGHDAIIEVFELVALWQLETACLQQQIAQYSGTLRGHVFVRCALLVLLESLKSLGNLLGPPFRKQLCEFMRDPTLDSRVRALHSRVCRQYATTAEEFGEARDALLAHRDIDASTRRRYVYEAGEQAVTDHIIQGLAIAAELTGIHLAYFEKLIGSVNRVAT